MRTLIDTVCALVELVAVIVAALARGITGEDDS